MLGINYYSIRGKAGFIHLPGCGMRRPQVPAGSTNNSETEGIEEISVYKIYSLHNTVYILYIRIKLDMKYISS